jgi:hypothetical protein
MINYLLQIASKPPFGASIAIALIKLYNISMLKFERSLDLILAENPPEVSTMTTVVAPLSAHESLIASRGLWTQINVLYDAVLRTSNHSRALQSVYELIDEDVDQFRQRAHNLASALNPDRVKDESRVLAAAAIDYLILGKHSHKSGVWLKGKAREEQLIDQFNIIISTDELEFHELSEWAGKQTVSNDRFWRQQIQRASYNPHVAELREAIHESDHHPVEV